MERTIKITGQAKLSVKPDTICLSLHLEDVKPTYEKTLEESSKQVQILKDCLEKSGFEKNNLKTVLFNVDAKYESYQDRRHNWQRKFVGYKFVHLLKFEFAQDHDKLGKILYALSQLPISPQININYTIKDPEAVKNQLLSKAVTDSRQKAEILTKAAGVTLGDIVSMDYSWQEVALISKPARRSLEAPVMLREKSESYNINVEPEDIDISDTVTIVWSIL